VSSSAAGIWEAASYRKPVTDAPGVTADGCYSENWIRPALDRTRPKPDVRVRPGLGEGERKETGPVVCAVS